MTAAAETVSWSKVRQAKLAVERRFRVDLDEEGRMGKWW